MRYLVLCLLILTFTTPNLIYAQNSEQIYIIKTETSDSSRYEVIQNSRTTLKLDKYTGTVFELLKSKDLVKTKDELYAWEAMKRIPQDNDKNESLNRINYQIIALGTGIKYTFLININTGATWKLADDPSETKNYWHPVKSQE
jgi:hypothetical protein